MEGYSVTEAASVLGVPAERVWELLARGVLAGHPEGDSGMRVFLQPRPAAAPSRMDLPPPAPAPEREPERELSPFRELLTEFRNLTERYGQALLALGEARGEVASLRSRVDLLEARMDLRLPMAASASGSVAWDAPASAVSPPVRDVETEMDAATATEAVVVEPPPVEVVGQEDGLGGAEAGEVTPTLDEAGDVTATVDEAAEAERPRRRSHHHATESFAEALARAEDPTVPELPEPHRDTLGEAMLDASLPRELPAAESIPTVDAEAGADEPDAVASEPAPVDVEAEPSEAEGAHAPGPTEAEPGPVEVEAESAPHDAAAEEPPEELDQPLAQPEAGEAEDRAPAAPVEAAPDEVVGAPDRGLDGAPRSVDEGVLTADAEQPAPEVGPPEPRAEAGARLQPSVPSEPLIWDPERYTTEIGEPDWYAEDEAIQPVSTQPSAVEPPSEPQPEAPASAETEAGAEAAAADGPEWPREDEPVEPAASGAAEALPDDDGQAEMEVAGAGHPTAAPSAPETSRPSDDPLERLDALARSADGPPTPAAPTRPVTPDPVAEYRASLTSPVPSPGIGPRPARTSPLPPTTASRAYRRLRRIFPG